MEKVLEKVKYSFVLPAYKANYLRESIDSILGQTYTDFELIIVNDASPEDVDSIVNSYNDKRIQYYKNEDKVILRNEQLSQKANSKIVAEFNGYDPSLLMHIWDYAKLSGIREYSTKD